MCQSRDGEVYPMSEKSVSFNFLPLHPRCRSTVAPYIEGTGHLGTRIVDNKKTPAYADANVPAFSF